MERLASNDSLKRVMNSTEVFESMQVDTGGRGVRWGTVAHVSSADLRTAGQNIDLSWNDIARVVASLIMDAHDAADVLSCSRQNINSLVKRGKLRPVKSSGKATLFLRSEIMERAQGL